MPDGLFDTKNSQAAGRSAPGVFSSETFDFQLMRWLSQAPYAGSRPWPGTALLAVIR